MTVSIKMQFDPAEAPNMRSTGNRTDSATPQVAALLLMRGRVRLIWTAILAGVFLLVALPLQVLLDQASQAPVALVAFSIAWLWGRTAGTATAILASIVNTGWGQLNGLIEGWTTPVVADTVAIVIVSAVVGHISRTLERAFAARDRSVQAYTELEVAHRDRMLTITDKVPVGLYRTTPEGRIMGGNDALMTILGFDDRESMLSTNVWDHYVHSEERRERIESAEDDSTWRKYQLRRADGTVIWVRDWSVAVRDAHGEVVHFDGVLEDITEQRLADARFQAAFEDAPIGMAIAGRDGRMIKGNKAVSDLLGIPADKLVGMHFSEYSFNEDLATTAAALERLEAGEVVRYEKRLRRPDGSHLWALISLAPISAGEDTATRFVSHVVDITDRRKAREALEDLIRSKDELIASVSHELRTPLTVVHGLAQELDSGWLGFSVPEQKEFIAMIAQQSAEVAYIVEDLLVAARADIGRLPIQPDRVDLLDQLEAGIAANDLDLSVERVGSNGSVAFADANRVRQIVRNLLSNAQRYGGPVIEVRCGADSSTAWLEVADDGDGIPAEDVSVVFEPYQRSHNAEGQPLSVGLGLTVSLKLARLMGGALTYRYVDGWSVFRLELPASGSIHSVPATAEGGATS
jgi:PAS domain S-box-containing protein